MLVAVAVDRHRRRPQPCGGGPRRRRSSGPRRRRPARRTTTTTTGRAYSATAGITGAHDVVGRAPAARTPARRSRARSAATPATMQNIPMPNTASALRGWAIEAEQQGDGADDGGDRHGPVRAPGGSCSSTPTSSTGSTIGRHAADRARCASAGRAGRPVIWTGSSRSPISWAWASVTIWRISVGARVGAGVAVDLAPGPARRGRRASPPWRAPAVVAIWVRIVVVAQHDAGQVAAAGGVERDALQVPAAGGQGEARRRRRRRASPPGHDAPGESRGSAP